MYGLRALICETFLEVRSGLGIMPPSRLIRPLESRNSLVVTCLGHDTTKLCVRSLVLKKSKTSLNTISLERLRTFLMPECVPAAFSRRKLAIHLSHSDIHSPHSLRRGPSVSTSPVNFTAAHRFTTTACSPISTQDEAGQPRLTPQNQEDRSVGRRSVVESVTRRKECSETLRCVRVL